MTNRAAIETIKGYFYQFDYSIMKILQLNKYEDLAVIEGIEDLDVETVDESIAVQCKYYASTEYNHSVISKPIRLMLNHYKDVKSGIKSSVQYYLYGHYKSGQNKLALPITVDFLKKNFLTYTQNKVKYLHHSQLNLTDEELLDFISKLTININAQSYDEQKENILNLLEENFNCTKFEAEHYYYNNALKVIKELATESDISNRKITKKDFISKINNKKLLFNEWFLTLKGKEKHLKNIKKEYFTHLNVEPFERIFLIDVDEKDYKRSSLKELVILIAKKWSKLSRREPNPFCPYIYINNITDEELMKLKTELYTEGYNFVDGFPFAGCLFSVKSICQTANSNNNIKLKIINKLDHIDSIIKETQKTKEIYLFYLNSPYYNLNNESVKHIQIQVESYSDIKEVI